MRNDTTPNIQMLLGIEDTAEYLNTSFIRDYNIHYLFIKAPYNKKGMLDHSKPRNIFRGCSKNLTIHNNLSLKEALFLSL